ncbi:hypothetical protein TNCV_4413291 [Trichonephila clavipes]|nr:hypothetical protein TNCV_4413291 [Trichonephila clavipes]
MRWVFQHIAPHILNEDPSAGEAKGASQVDLKDIAEKGFQKCFDYLYKPWQKCVVAQGSYFEGGCVSTV